MGNLDEVLVANAVSHLYNIADMLPHSTSNTILKTAYLLKCRKLGIKHYSLPSKFFKSSIRCPRCCNQHFEGISHYKIQPQRKNNRFERRLLKRFESNKQLTKFQQEYMNQLKGQEGNKLSITCGVCKKEVTQTLEKPKQQCHDLMETPNKPRKKRKKDKFSGLNKEVVLASTPQSNKISETLKTRNKINETRGEWRSTFKRSKMVSIETPKRFNNNKAKNQLHTNKLKELLAQPKTKTKSMLANFLQSL